MIWVVLVLSFIGVVMCQIGLPTPGAAGPGGTPVLTWWVLFYGLHHTRGPALTAAALAGLALCALGPGLPAACVASQAAVALAALALKRVANAASPLTVAGMGALAGGWHVATQAWMSAGAAGWGAPERLEVASRLWRTGLIGVPGVLALFLSMAFLERIAGLREDPEWHLA